MQIEWKKRNITFFRSAVELYLMRVEEATDGQLYATPLSKLDDHVAYEGSTEPKPKKYPFFDKFDALNCIRSALGR